MPAGAAPAEHARPPFEAARYDEAARVVRFTPFVTVDWEKVARRRFRRFDIDRPRPKDIAYLRQRIWEISGNTELKLRAPMEPGVARGTYSLISTVGILPVKAAVFEATVSFAFDHADLPQLIGRTYFGEVVSRRIAFGGGGGFVFWSPTHERPSRIGNTTASLTQEGGRSVLSYADERSHASVNLPQPWHSKFLAAYGLGVAGERYLFVAWPQDTGMIEAGCRHGFSLYAVRETLAEVSASSYDCDV